MNDNNAIDFLNRATRFIGIPLSEAGKNLRVTRSSGHFKDWPEHSYWEEFEHRKQHNEKNKLKGLAGNIVQHLFTGQSPDSRSGKDSFYEVKSFEVWLKDGQYIPKEHLLKIASLNYKDVSKLGILDIDLVSKILQSFWVPILIPPPPCWSHRTAKVSLTCDKCSSSRQLNYDVFYRLERAILLKPIVFVPTAAQLFQIGQDYNHYQRIIQNGNQDMLSLTHNRDKTSMIVLNTSGNSSAPSKKFTLNGKNMLWKERSWYMHPDLKKSLVSESGTLFSAE